MSHLPWSWSSRLWSQRKNYHLSGNSRNYFLTLKLLYYYCYNILYRFLEILKKYIFNFYIRRMRKLAKWPPAIVMEFLRCTNRCVNSSLHARIMQNITPGNASLIQPKVLPSVEAVIRISTILSLFHQSVSLFHQLLSTSMPDKKFLLFFCIFPNKSIFGAGFNCGLSESIYIYISKFKVNAKTLRCLFRC